VPRINLPAMMFGYERLLHLNRTIGDQLKEDDAK
jgi:hypothetical protein